MSSSDNEFSQDRLFEAGVIVTNKQDSLPREYFEPEKKNGVNPSLGFGDDAQDDFPISSEK